MKYFIIFFLFFILKKKKKKRNLARNDSTFLPAFYPFLTFDSRDSQGTRYFCKALDNYSLCMKHQAKKRLEALARHSKILFIVVRSNYNEDTWSRYTGP